MAEHTDHGSTFTVEKIKQVFWCMTTHTVPDVSVSSSTDLCERCCNFLNSCSESIISPDEPYICASQSQLDSGKRRKISKPSNSTPDDAIGSDHIFSSNVKNNTNDTNSDIPSKSFKCNTVTRTTRSSEQFKQTLDLLSSHLQELQNELFALMVAESKDTALFFDHLQVISCDLIKLKRFLTLKSSIENCQVTSKATSNDSSTISISYDLYMSQLLDHKLLSLQLVHFECVIFRFLSLPQINTCLFESLLQPILRNYYTLLLKLSYEHQFQQLIRRIHCESITVSAKLLCVLFRLFTSNKELKSSNTLLRSNELESISNNRLIVSMLLYLGELARLDLYATKGNILKSIEFPKQSDGSIDYSSLQQIATNHIPNNNGLIPEHISLVEVCQEILVYFGHKPDFRAKSNVRFRAIVLLRFICRRKELCLWDAFCSGPVMLSSILDMLDRCLAYHTEMCKSMVLDLTIGQQVARSSPRKTSGWSSEKEAQLKSYKRVLRDIYNLLSILLSFSECTFTREFMRFLDAHHKLYDRFMSQFVYSLNGTEYDDPDYLNNTCLQETKCNDRAQAYRLLRDYATLYRRVFKLLDRTVSFCSLFVQRVLDPLPLPLGCGLNPFQFTLPVVTQVEASWNQHLDSEDGVLLNDTESDFEESMMDDETDDESNDTQANSSDSNLSPLLESSNVLHEAYLSYFPEAKHFNWKMEEKQDEPLFGSGYQNVLSCMCNNEMKNILLDHTKYLNLSVESVEKSVKKDLNFNWKDVYGKMYQLTKSVLPRDSVPKPELNMTGSTLNELPQPLTYPFLKRASRRKNMHHIKMLDLVRERIEHPKGWTGYALVYDVEHPRVASTDSERLCFDSRFECGNLGKAFYRPSGNEKEEEYLLILNTDVNSPSHTQWFYFSVTAMKPDRRYRFKVINCEKCSILFNSGQQPVFYSQHDYEIASQNWQRIGADDRQISVYYRNHYVRSSSLSSVFKEKPFYTMEFTFTFPHSDDHCYFAYNLPYSYSLLKTNLAYWSHVAKEVGQDSVFFQVQTLCSTLRGNELPVMTITSNSHHSCSSKVRPHYIFLTARVHPSESNSSWILKGFVDFLLMPSNDSVREQVRKELLQTYIFKIIPMLNPDGVINGCTRTDLQTNDLNRHWDEPSSILHPTIYHSKMLLKCLHYLSSGSNPVAFLDLHGHSRHHNIFAYSCFPYVSWRKTDRQRYLKQSSQNQICPCAFKNGSSCQLEQNLKQLQASKADSETYIITPSCMALPLALHLQKSPAFELDNCCYVVQRDRESTARIVAWRHFEIPLVYTVECSAAGCDFGPYAGYHLTRTQLEEMGHHLATSFSHIRFLYCSPHHLPLLVFPTESIPPIDATLIDNTLNKCVKSSKSNCLLNQNQKKQKKKLAQIYPDLTKLSKCKDILTSENDVNNDS